jgi:hypothetical protein
VKEGLPRIVPEIKLTQVALQMLLVGVMIGVVAVFAYELPLSVGDKITLNGPYESHTE